MKLIDRIRDLSNLPPKFNTMMENSLLAVQDKTSQENLSEVACIIANAAWEKWISWRKPEDNRLEHEWVVFDNVMKIAEAEGISLSERRIATAFCFLHDTCFIKRIMEEDIRRLEREGRNEEAVETKLKKKNQRTEHMKGGAENSEKILSELSLLTQEEINQCVEIVSTHDSWKLDPPQPPSTQDRLRLACLEGDALWPLHPLGVLADLERSHETGEMKDFNDPMIWRQQLQQSNQTLVDYRLKWKDIPASAFMDDVSIFRTQEGWRLYNQWQQHWNLKEATKTVSSKTLVDTTVPYR